MSVEFKVMRSLYHFSQLPIHGCGAEQWQRLDSHFIAVAVASSLLQQLVFTSHCISTVPPLLNPLHSEALGTSPELETVHLVDRAEASRL